MGLACSEVNALRDSKTPALSSEADPPASVEMVLCGVKIHVRASSSIPEGRHKWTPTYPSTYPLNPPTCPNTGAPTRTHSYTPPCTHPLTHPATHPPTHSRLYALTHTPSKLNHLHTHLLTHPLTHPRHPINPYPTILYSDMFSMLLNSMLIYSHQFLL